MLTWSKLETIFLWLHTLTWRISKGFAWRLSLAFWLTYCSNIDTFPGSFCCEPWQNTETLLGWNWNIFCRRSSLYQVYQLTWQLSAWHGLFVLISPWLSRWALIRDTNSTIGTLGEMTSLKSSKWRGKSIVVSSSLTTIYFSSMKLATFADCERDWEVVADIKSYSDLTRENYNCNWQEKFKIKMWQYSANILQPKKPCMFQTAFPAFSREKVHHSHNL